MRSRSRQAAVLFSGALAGGVAGSACLLLTPVPDLSSGERGGGGEGGEGKVGGPDAASPPGDGGAGDGSVSASDAPLDGAAGPFCKSLSPAPMFCDDFDDESQAELTPRWDVPAPDPNFGVRLDR